ncbi:uncharacterized protein LOC122665661 [Telopea speciosissima]|uniref:uncharacterized protein LOC122665661 n=1 Tax=Telopea speciosissima TaxID=54955 RepID=UPI001CC43C3A|nr:uncharacterized protein LOC122665661 [Telopea speciosissima]
MSIGSMMAQIDQIDGEEHAIYYLSRKLQEYETRYTPMEKTCTSLVWVTKRLRHYMISHPIKLVSRMDPIKYLFEKPALTRRMARWLLLLSEFDITQLPEGEWMRSRYEALNLLDEKRMKAMDNLQKYQQRMARAFNKGVVKIFSNNRAEEEGRVQCRKNAYLFCMIGKYLLTTAGKDMSPMIAEVVK